MIRLLHQNEVMCQLLLSSFDSIAIVPEVNRFFQRVLFSLITHIRGQREMTLNKARMMAKIFGYDKNFSFFYNHYGQGDQVNDAALKPSEDYFLEGPILKYGGKNEKLGPSTSRLCITNINLFGDAGGFDAILEALPSAPISLVHQYVYLVTNLKNRTMSPSFGKDYGAKFLEVAYARLHALQLDDHRVLYNSEDTWTIMLQNLEFFAGFPDLKGFPVHECVEKAWCSLSRLFLSSPTIAIRVRGVVLLDYHILKAIRRAEEAEEAPLVQQKQSTAKYMTRTHMCSWVLNPSNPTLGIILGISSIVKELGFDGPHNEVLKRSSELFSILAKEKALQESVLDRLWDISRQAADEDLPLQAAALHVLEETMPHMSEDLLHALLRKFSAVQPPLNTRDIEFFHNTLLLHLDYTS
jgi:hypothetical protein